MNNMTMYGAMAGIAAVAVIFAIIAALVGLGFYVFTGYVLYKLAKKRGVDNAWLAWIPYGNLYLVGEIGGPMTLLGKWRIEKTGLILLLAPVAGWIVSMVLGFFTIIPVLGVLFALVNGIFSFLWPIAFLAFYLCVLYRIFTAYVPKNTALVYTLVSIITFAMPFFVMSILNKEPICEGYDFTF